MDKNGSERREFPRLPLITPLAYKICKKETLTKLFEGYTVNVSQNGLLCNIKDKVNMDDILWLSFNKSDLSFCQDMDKTSFVYQNGIVGKVVRIEGKDDGTFDVGINIITREEKNLTNIYPRIHFMDKH
ncbi:MAG TPA: PilZ domain-containing protein [Candidatus Omnitrophota bacterium]|nr:PilZ domain-containing protein [Candidatus Omnitrophota bacterium]HRZ15123.1 PilZ domain-containing protein [Candidatus Omnitrophota bacterium]